jgi:peptidoglycan/xylan/chitin deacetylase (PgdA/CDA1 family)
MRPESPENMSMPDLRSMAGAALRHAPVSFWQRCVPKSTIGLCYHVVSDSELAHVKHYRPLTTATFEADLAYLQTRFPIGSYEQLMERQHQSRPRDNSVILSFDDGFVECATVVAPLLNRHGLFGIFFIITDLIDNAAVFRESIASLCIDEVLRRPWFDAETIVRELRLAARLSIAPGNSNRFIRPPLEMAGLAEACNPSLRPLLHWLLTAGDSDIDALKGLASRLRLNPGEYVHQVQPYLTSAQILALQSAGSTIGAHSCSHRLLQTLPMAEAEREIVNSCRLIRDLTGQRSVPFAFPYSGSGIDRNWLADLRRRHDFIGLFFDTDGMAGDADFVIQRVFGERLGYDGSLDGILRRAWSRPRAWRGAS